MNKDYTKYKAHQLLNDDYFLKSVLHPTAQDHQFWQQLQDENESFRQEMQIAHSFLKHLQKLLFYRKESKKSSGNVFRQRIISMT